MPLQLSAVIEAVNYMRKTEGFETKKVRAPRAIYEVCWDCAASHSHTMASLMWGGPGFSPQIHEPLLFMGLPIYLDAELPSGVVALEGDGVQLLGLGRFEVLALEARIEHKRLKNERLTRHEWLMARENPAVETPEPPVTAFGGPTRYTRLSQDERPPRPPPEPPKPKGLRGLLRKVFPNLGTNGVET